MSGQIQQRVFTADAGDGRGFRTKQEFLAHIRAAGRPAPGGGRSGTGSTAVMREMTECRRLIASALLDAADLKQEAADRSAERSAEDWFDGDEYDDWFTDR